MKYNPRIHHRRSTRLKGYNYARAGSYFITLNCRNRNHLFGEISDGKMILNEYGSIAYQEWLRTPEVRPNVDLGVFVIMPDHVHGIIIIREDVLGWNDGDNFNSTSARGVLHPPRAEVEKDQGGCDTPRSFSSDSIESSKLPRSFSSDSTESSKLPRSVSSDNIESGKLIRSISSSNYIAADFSKVVFSRPSFISASQTVGAILRGYMGTVTSQINKIRNTPGEKVWQRNFHDHIIRNIWSFHRISNYIIRNPVKYKE